MKTKTTILPLLMALVITGCDTIYGVSRHAAVSRVPDPSTVKSLIEQVPGVERVDYSFSEASRPLTIKGIQAPDRIHTFRYSGGENIHGVLQFDMNYTSNIVFRQTLLRMNQRPPQCWVDATRPVMKEIEKRLAAECQLTGLSTGVVERCHGVK